MKEGWRKGECGKKGNQSNIKGKIDWESTPQLLTMMAISCLYPLDKPTSGQTSQNNIDLDNFYNSTKGETNTIPNSNPKSK